MSYPFPVEIPVYSFNDWASAPNAQEWFSENGLAPIWVAGEQAYSDGISWLSTRKGVLRNSIANAGLYRSFVPNFDYSALTSLTNWLDASTNTVIRSGSQTNILYFDPENGNDSNSGSRLSPKRTLPTSWSDNTTFCLRGGCVHVFKSLISLGINTIITTYDAHRGQAIIDASAATGQTKVFFFGQNGAWLNNIDVIGPPGLDQIGGRAIGNVYKGMTGIRITNNRFRFANEGSGYFSIGLIVENADFIVEGNYFDGIPNCMQVNTWSIGNTLPANGGVSLIRFNKFRCSNGNLSDVYFTDNGDCLGFAGEQFDFQYKLWVDSNEFTGHLENAIDTNRALRLVITRNYVHDNAFSPLSAGTSNIMVGSSMYGDESRCIVIGNYVKNIWGVALSTRRSANNLFMGNIVDGADVGWSNGVGPSANAHHNRCVHNTFVNISETEYAKAVGLKASAILVGDDQDYTEVFNNILHVSKSTYDGASRYIGGLWSNATNTRSGGNILAGPVMFQPNGTYSGKEFIPNNWFPNLSDVIDPITYTPTSLVVKQFLEKIAVDPLDALYSKFSFRCAGAVAPDEGYRW